MNPNTPQHSPSLAPYLFYDDVDSAARFMQEAFGFRVAFTSPGPNGVVEHAQLLHDNGLIMIGQAAGGLGLVKPANQLAALHAGVYIFVNDVDAHFEQARKAGAKILETPADRPWGDRMYCALDPEGQFWMFGKRLAGKAG